LPYLNTGHSSQGSAIEGAFVVADLRSPYIDRNWLYTAVTRLKFFKDLYFLDVDLRPPRKACLDRARYLLCGYKQQDKMAGRQAADEEYWTPEELLVLNGQQPNCANCKQPSSIMDRGMMQASFQRSNNALPHTRRNTEQLICRRCNSSLK
jgi:hypothetical protein